MPALYERAHQPAWFACRHSGVLCALLFGSSRFGQFNLRATQNNYRERECFLGLSFNEKTQWAFCTCARARARLARSSAGLSLKFRMHNSNLALRISATRLNLFCLILNRPMIAAARWFLAELNGLQFTAAFVLARTPPTRARRSSLARRAL